MAARRALKKLAQRGPQACASLAQMRANANVYIDGFNLYFRALKDGPYKWLDPWRLSRLLLPEYEVHRVRYFTAIVESRPGDPQQQQRQQAYLRALGTLPRLSVHFGTFMTKPRRLPLASPRPGWPRTVEVLRTEEKGSDVNLATFMLVDGFKRDYEVAVVVSNDSDLKEPIRAVREDLSLTVGVVITDPNMSESALPADFHRRLRPRALAAAQLPAEMQDDWGTIRKPVDW